MIWYLYLQCRGLRTSRFISFGPGNRQEFYAFRESQKDSEGTCPGNSLSIGAFSIHVRCRGAHVRSLEILLWHCTFKTRVDHFRNLHSWAGDETTRMIAGPRRKNAEEEEGRRKNKKGEFWIRSRKWTKLIMIKLILSCEYMIALFYSVITYI